ncbi:MAG: hypothetical protein AAGA44_15225 [Pseudomonadota bacterium]
MSDVVELASSALYKAIDLHAEGNYLAISDVHDAVDVPLFEATQTLEHSQLTTNLKLVRSFLDGWADSSNHNWQYYDGISRDDWPLLAEQLVESLKSNSEHTSKAVLENFSV